MTIPIWDVMRADTAAGQRILFLLQRREMWWTILEAIGLEGRI